MTPGSPASRLSRAAPAGVLVAAVALAAVLFAGYWPRAAAGWWWPTHDRHAHYLHGLNVAFDLRTLDLPRLRHDLDALRVWGPLHGLLVAAVQLLAGGDHRLAVLPSLAGWVLLVWFGFLLPRRMLERDGTLAGVVVAGVLAALPAYRAYATDVMLESLGAGLSLAALYCYLAAVQDQTRRAGVALAVALLALFFLKYNYWLLVVLGLGLGEALRTWRFWLEASTHWRTALPYVRREACHPLNFLAALLFAAACYVWKSHGTTVRVGSVTLALTEPHNLFMVGFWAVFLRGLLWWRGEGRELLARLNPALRPVVVINAWGIGLWFLLPKRLGYFLWYLSPANSAQEFKSTTLLDGAAFYFRAVQEDYSYIPFGVVLLLALLPLAAVVARRLRPGSAAVLAFFAVGVYLTMQHAMTKHRFAHSWLAAGWVLAVVAVFAVGGLTRWRWASAAAGLLLLALHAPGWFAAGHANEGGPKADVPSPLVVTDAYLPHLADARYTTILSNVPARYLFGWTFLEARRHTRFATSVPHFKERLERDPRRLSTYLDTTPSDAIVLVEMHPGSPFAHTTEESLDLTLLTQTLAAHPGFARTHEWHLPEGVTIRLWARTSAPGPSPARRDQP